jgi:hypothetical protein
VQEKEGEEEEEEEHFAPKWLLKESRCWFECMQRIARMYMPRHKGARLPHFAIAFNVLVMPTGNVLSVDEALLAHSVSRSELECGFFILMQPFSRACRCPHRSAAQFRAWFQLSRQRLQTCDAKQ